MSQSNVAQAASSSSRPKTRLTRSGIAYLTNYAQRINPYPQRDEKLDILATIRTIPGNESCTMQKLTGWFARHRNPSGDAKPTVLVDDESILFPKLTPMHFQQLRVLYKKRTDPSEGIVTFWAERIKAERAEVAAWIQYQQEKAKEDHVHSTPESSEVPLQQLMGEPVSDSPSVSPTMSEFPRPHLPTPAKSPSISPQTRIPSLPPIAVKLEESRQCLSPVSSLNTHSGLYPSEPRSVLEGFPPLKRHLLQASKLSPLEIVAPDIGRRDSKSLTATIRESLEPDAFPSEQPPKTVDEFAAKFAKVEGMIEMFMKKYECGQLSGLGWDSSLSKPT